MLPTNEKFNGDSYTIIPWSRGQQTLIYMRSGDYQGTWMILARDENEYVVYRDYYGSCSGCDAFEGHFSYSRDIDFDAAVEFAKDYHSFIEVPRSTMRNLVTNGKEALERIFPGNLKDSEIDMDQFLADTILSVKLDEGMEVTAENILKAPNAELKQRALKAFGYERFVSEVEMEEIDKDGENALLRKGDIVFAYVKDASTPRRYLLRVPPNMKTVKNAIAWTFNLTTAQYQPLIET